MFPQRADKQESSPHAIDLSMTGGHSITRIHAAIQVEQATSEEENTEVTYGDALQKAAFSTLAKSLAPTAAATVGAALGELLVAAFNAGRHGDGSDAALKNALPSMRRALDIQIVADQLAHETLHLQFKLIEGKQFLSNDAEARAPRVACASIAPLSHRVRSIHADRLSRAKEAGIDQDAVTLLQQFDPAIKDLDILARQGTFADVRIRHDALGLAPLNAFGDGMRRALLYALTIPQVRGGVLLIDEIESAIHVRALSGVFAWLTRACEQFDVQIFASTHSLEALESLLGEDDHSSAHVVGFHLPGRPGEAAATRYDGDILTRLVRERGLDVR
jgi:hypothetical protein